MANERDGTSRNAVSLLKTQLNDAVKEYIAYDASDRMEYHYIAAATADDGDPCLVTRYAYRGPTSSQILYRAESIGVWDTSWESF